MDFEYLNYLEAFSGDHINTENCTQEIQTFSDIQENPEIVEFVDDQIEIIDESLKDNIEEIQQE